MWHPKPRHQQQLHKLWCTPLHCRSTLPRKRPRTLPPNGKRMLWLAQRRHDCRRHNWCHHSSCWVSLVLASHLWHIDRFLAIHNNHLRRAHRVRCAFWKTQTIWRPLLTPHPKLQRPHATQVRLLFHSESKILNHNIKTINPSTYPSTSKLCPAKSASTK